MNPALGKFIQKDPAGYSAGPNLYDYCNNDPINHSDPSGLAWWFHLQGDEADVWTSVTTSQGLIGYLGRHPGEVDFVSAEAHGGFSGSPENPNDPNSGPGTGTFQYTFDLSDASGKNGYLSVPDTGSQIQGSSQVGGVYNGAGTATGSNIAGLLNSALTSTATVFLPGCYGGNLAQYLSGAVGGTDRNFYGANTENRYDPNSPTANYVTVFPNGVQSYNQAYNNGQPDGIHGVQSVFQGGGVIDPTTVSTGVIRP